MKNSNKSVLLPVTNLRCLRDPDCQRHPHHGGHLHRIGPIDPRVIYQAHQRRRNAGRRAWQLIRKMETAHWGPKVKFTDSSQRQQVFRHIQTELLSTHLLPI